MGHFLTIHAAGPTHRLPRTMTAPSLTLPPLYLRQLAEQVTRSAGSHATERWLGARGLTLRALEDPTLTVSFEAFQSLVSQAMEVTDEPAFGLLVGERLVASTHGILGYAVLTSGSVGAAIELLERYIALRFSLIGVTRFRPRSRRSLEVRFHETRPLGAIARPVFETVLVSVARLIATLTPGRSPVQAVSFPFPRPSYAAFAHDVFACAVTYEAGAGFAALSLPLDALDAPLSTADPQAFREAAAICQRELDKLTDHLSLGDRVRQLLLERPQGAPSLQLAARTLHLTPRTLHRRLVDEGTSYRALLDEVRSALAQEQLSTSNLSIEAIALSLGYTDLANFRRAFKRWTGSAPSVFRAAAAHEGSSGSGPHGARAGGKS